MPEAVTNEEIERAAQKAREYQEVEKKLREAQEAEKRAESGSSSNTSYF